MKKTSLNYFLAANSGEGFYSVFDKSYLTDGRWRAYIIKGGPGTGKSTLMKRVATSAELRGIKALRCPCSSDPASLDAVILPDNKIAIMDGTSPHTVEPKFPGACEQIINLGELWNERAFDGRREKIIGLTMQNKALHSSASGFIRAAGILLADNRKKALACTDTEKAERFAKGLCKKLITVKNSEIPGREWVRFVGGVTPQGFVAFPETVLAQAGRLVIIDDKYAAAASVITDYVRRYALSSGYEIITLKNPFLPSLVTDHIIIPKLNLAIATENDLIGFDTDVRRVHSRRFSHIKGLHTAGAVMRFNRRTANELLKAAYDTLQKAKNVHDSLEAYYIGAMDFKKLDRLCDKIIGNILG